MPEIKVEGLEELLSKFKNLENIDVPESCLAGAEVLRHDAMKNAPVKTGFLRQSHIAKKTEEGASLEVQAEYGFFVEYGTSKWAGHPWLRASIENAREKIFRAVNTHLKKQVDTLAGK